MVEVSALKKIYHLDKKQMKRLGESSKLKVAVADVSFKAQAGAIFGLLGPNGAGKTTTLRCIATLLTPTEGHIQVAGLDVKENPENIRRKIAFLTNELKLEGHFTPKYTMSYFGKLYGMSQEEVTRRRNSLFKVFGIDAFENVRISDLSTGMKQKLSIAVSLIHDPEVVIFDEPTNGLDIITAKAVTDYLQVLKAQGKTIIISTHIMSVAQKLCDRLAIVLAGRVVSSGTVQEVLEREEAVDLEEAFFKLYEKHQGEASQ